MVLPGSKLFNAGKFVHQQSGPEGGISRDLDLSFLAGLEASVARASEALDTFEHAAALDVVERFFWSRFTDSYVEMVKARARAEDDPEGRASAVTALLLGLRVFLRLFAPFLPYVTEEVWSWWQDGSIHLAEWPASFGDRAAEDTVLDAVAAALMGIRGAKSQAKVSMKAPLARVEISGPADQIALVEQAADDLRESGKIIGDLVFSPLDGAEELSVQTELAPTE